MSARIIAILIFATSVGGASPSAKFSDEDLVVRDGSKAFKIPSVLDAHAFYATIHAVQRRGQSYFVVYGTSEMSRGWPPKGGNCGSGLESYIRWIHVKGGKVIEQQEGRQESCIKNRDGWSIAWRDRKLVWSTQGIERRGDPVTGKIVSVAFTWSYDPGRPSAGISETKSPAKWQLETTMTEQVEDTNPPPRRS